MLEAQVYATFGDDLALLVKILRLTPKNEFHTHWAQGLSASLFLLSASLFLLPASEFPLSASLFLLSASLFLRLHHHLSASLFGLSLQWSRQSQN